MRDQTVSVEIDDVAASAYVRFSRNRTMRTIAHDDAINIDLDEFGMVVGIEVLHLAAELPFAALTADYHVDSAKVELLRSICPTISGFVARFQTEGSLASAQRRVPTRA